MLNVRRSTKESIETRARFNILRYSNCWEDADILSDAINTIKGGKYLSIASAGDNSLSILSKDPSLVLAVDINPVQLACVEIRKEAFKYLSYGELLEFMGVSPSGDRKAYYLHIRSGLSDEARLFWDRHPDLIRAGVIHAGKFEKYFSLFRRFVLPLIHTRQQVDHLLSISDASERTAYYEKSWNTLRWKLLFKAFFSRRIMGKLGRDPEFFKYVETDVATRIFRRAEYALTVLPADTNPYLEYILTGNFGNSLPFYLRRENFDSIRSNLDKLVIFKGNLREAFEGNNNVVFDGFNLSDIFEYMSIGQYAEEISRIVDHANPGARLVYWNMLADRKDIEGIGKEIRFLDMRSEELFRRDKAFFYKSLVIAEVL